MKPRQILPLTPRNGVQLQLSPRGVGASVCEMPTTSLVLFMPTHCTVLRNVGDVPSVPRSSGSPSSDHKAACRAPSDVVEYPETQPRLLIALPRLSAPPPANFGRTVTSYATPAALAARCVDGSTVRGVTGASLV